ncbi:MAG TPA: right-handed parallel beta-helix repeat-containing protein, partial [Thermoplasmata archaeon]|nr:right-handed parallel beta-helix repeat-containing protein [Thermoplasmata archaeon]
WTSNDSAVCEVKGYYQGTAHGSSVQLLLKAVGVCSVTVTAATVSGTRTNTTGDLTVLLRTTVTVDDSGGADFLTIQEGVDFAQAGYTVFIYAGTYPENVVVGKELEIVGESRAGVLVNGGGSDGMTITADRVVLHTLTILNARRGVFQDRTNNTRVYDTTIKDYDVGLFNEHTLNAWVAYNLITHGHIGVLTNVSYDDAIRWNEISFNDKYGAKSFNTRLRNCFNWNSLHDNAIGYFHDPTSDYPPMEFDGNLLTDNGIGVKVENASSVTLTNNTFTGGSLGVQLLNSSSVVDSNTFTGLVVGIQCRASNSNLTNNAIDATTTGIACDGGAPRIEGNDILVASGEAILLSNLDGAIVAGNDLHGGTLRVSNSRLARLAPVNSVVLLEDTIVDALLLDATSRVEVRWTVRVRAVNEAGAPLPDHDVVVRDATGGMAFHGVTGTDGSAAGIVLHTETLRIGVTESWNPFTVTVTGSAGSGSRTTSVAGSSEIVVAVLIAPTPPPSPRGPDLLQVIVLSVAIAASASLAGAFAIERSRYSLLSLFLPLYSRLSKDKVLENYNRGRVYQYVELNPGAHFNAILAGLRMNNGALVYHLEVLQKEGLVTSRQDGMYRRFYPRDVQPPPILENGTSEVQLRVLKAVQEMPGITQKELARILGLRQSTLAYQVDRLTAMGYVAGAKRGRKVHYSAKKGGN